MKTRFYEVKVTINRTLVIEVEDNGDEASKVEASEFAFRESFSGCGDVEVHEATLLKNDSEIEQAKRHADEVFDL